MWKYVRLCSNNSPMAEILSQCSDKTNLRLVIYHLSENHVECATVPNVEEFNLRNVAREILNDARNGNHAILAYDVRYGKVFLVDSTPELPIASAVLLCVVTELLNGCVMPRQAQCGAPQVREEMECDCNEEMMFRMPEVARRDARGRFIRKEEVCNCSTEPWRNPPTRETADSVLTKRFRLGHR